MPNVKCLLCHNSTKRVKKEGSIVSFHRFNKAWSKKCNSNVRITKNSVLCSDHFLPEDFIRDLKAELMGLQTKKRLKNEAVPTRNMSNYVQEAPDLLEQESSDNPFLQKREIATQTCITQYGLITLQSTLKAVLDENAALKLHLRNFLQIENELKIMTNKNIELKTKLEVTEKKLREKSKQVTKIANSLQVYRKRCIDKPTIAMMKKKMSIIFTNSQLDVILKNKTSWSSEDIFRAFTIRYLSQKCYKYLHTTLKFPLPSLSTLQKWASKIRVRNGFLEDVIRMMSVTSTDMDDFEKIAVICYGEMKVKSEQALDHGGDVIMGPTHSPMQIIMVQGLFSSWKQPIYVNFNTKMTKSLLNEAVSRVYNVGFKVVACVSNCGSKNVSLWQELGITYEKTSFHHPETESPIFMFADSLQILTLIRKWLLDTGFCLENGTIITKKPLQELIRKTQESGTFCNLNEEHFKLAKTQTQNVRLASELLSYSTAVELKRYLKETDVSEFIDIIVSWFNVMNSYTPKTLATGFGSQLEEQTLVLKKAYRMVEGMKCVGKNCLMPFQKNLLMSINSLLNLQVELKRTMNRDKLCILTNRLNQDALENLFLQIGTREENDHPSVLNALKQIRIIIFGSNIASVQSNSSHVPNHRDIHECLLSRTLQKAGVNVTHYNADREMHRDEARATSVVYQNNSQIETDIDFLAYPVLDGYSEYQNCNEHDYALSVPRENTCSMED